MPSTLDIVNGQFLHTHTTDSSGDYSILLSTENKFLDKNIGIKITTPAAGTLSLAITNNSSTDVTVGTLNGTKYPLTANLGGTITAATAGWITNAANSVSANAIVVGTIDKTTIVTSADTGNLSQYFTSQQSSTGADVVIAPKYTATAGYTAAVTTATTNTGTTYWKIKTANPTFTAAPTGHSTASFSNITYDTTNNGIKVQTAYSIDAVNIYYNAAVNGWVNKAANTDTTSDTTATASTNDAAYYITGITVPTATNFTLTTTANNSSDSSKVTITNNNNRIVEFTNNTGSVYVRQTTSGKGDVYIRPVGASVDTQILDSGTMLTSSVSTPTWTKNSTTKVVTTGRSEWSDGYISSGHLDAATFSASAETNVTYLNLDDALKTTNGAFVVPELAANGVLYIKRGYIDNVSISLAHLIADASGTTSITAAHIRDGYSAYDSNGNLIIGTIPDLNATTYHPSTTNQTIAIGSYINGVQTINAVTTNATAAMIAYNTTLKIGDSSDDDCVTAIAGTFTQAGTQTTDQSVAAAAQILPGYSAWVNGAEVLGAMPNAAVVPGFSFPGSGDNDLDAYITSTGATSSSYDVRITPNYKNNTAGYLQQYTSAVSGTTKYYKLKTPTFTSAGGSIDLVVDTTDTDTKRSIYTSSSISYITISDSEPTLANGKVYIKIDSTGQIKTTVAGALKSNVTIATTGNKTRYIGLTLYDGSYTTGS